MAPAATNGFFAACASKIEVRQKSLMVCISGTLAHFVDRRGSLWSIASGRNASAMTRAKNEKPRSVPSNDRRSRHRSPIRRLLDD